MHVGLYLVIVVTKALISRGDRFLVQSEWVCRCLCTKKSDREVWVSACDFTRVRGLAQMWYICL